MKELVEGRRASQSVSVIDVVQFRRNETLLDFVSTHRDETRLDFSRDERRVTGQDL